MKILIVDDEVKICNIVKLLMEKQGYQTKIVNNGEDAVIVAKNDNFDIILLDMNLPGIDGLETMRQIQLLDNNQATQFIMITAYGSFKNAVKALKNGAFNYLGKPFDNDDLVTIVKAAIRVKMLSDKVRNLELLVDTDDPFTGIIGFSQVLDNCKKLAQKIANFDIPVLITGESGTGKELFVQAIHRLSQRKNYNLIPVNCTAIASNLFESEFFGYKKGSFTGANISSKGKFREAHKGSLFLDEIGDLPMEFQPKLLRVIENGELVPLGESIPTAVNTRIIAATNKNLKDLIQKGHFREDLFYRLNVFNIHLPPLRKRKDDIPILIKFFLNQSQKKISEEALSFASEYNWPGNVRELKNELKRAEIISDSIILPHHFSFFNSKANHKESSKFNIGSQIDNKDFNLEKYIIDLEKKYILTAMKKSGLNKSNAAKILGISYRVFNYKWEKYDLDNHDFF